jgi:hypothetical protein
MASAKIDSSVLITHIKAALVMGFFLRHFGRMLGRAKDRNDNISKVMTAISRTKANLAIDDKKVSVEAEAAVAFIVHFAETLPDEPTEGQMGRAEFLEALPGLFDSSINEKSQILPTQKKFYRLERVFESLTDFIIEHSDKNFFIEMASRRNMTFEEVRDQFMTVIFGDIVHYGQCVDQIPADYYINLKPNKDTKLQYLPQNLYTEEIKTLTQFVGGDDGREKKKKEESAIEKFKREVLLIHFIEQWTSKGCSISQYAGHDYFQKICLAPTSTSAKVLCALSHFFQYYIQYIEFFYFFKRSASNISNVSVKRPRMAPQEIVAIDEEEHVGNSTPSSNEYARELERFMSFLFNNLFFRRGFLNNK